MTAEERVSDRALRALLRVYRAAAPAGIKPKSWNLERTDVEAVAVWWALSPSVTELAARVVHHPREITTVSEAEERVTQGDIPGAINAGATVLHQIITGDPSAFVVAEHFDTYLSGPNRLLAVTLSEAWHLLDAAARDSDVIKNIAGPQLRLLESAMRVGGVKEVLAAPGGRRRVTPYEKRQAAKMRAYLYRLAYAAAVLLDGVRVLDPPSLSVLFEQAVLPNLEPWRRFELACLLEAALSLSRVTGDPVALDLAFTARRPAATVGPFALHWQYSISPRALPDLDTGERLARQLASSLGVQPGVRKADIALEHHGDLIAMVECKWFQSPADAPGAIADACDQLVVYARDHVKKHGGNVVALLSDSVVALAFRGSAPLVLTGSLVGCVDFDDIENLELDNWALGLTAGASTTPPSGTP